MPLGQHAVLVLIPAGNAGGLTNAATKESEHLFSCYRGKPWSPTPWRHAAGTNVELGVGFVPDQMLLSSHHVNSRWSVAPIQVNHITQGSQCGQVRHSPTLKSHQKD